MFIAKSKISFPLSKFSENSFKKWGNLFIIFFLGQTATQLIQVICGFLLVRWLSIDEYAQYTAAFAFQTTAHVLVEFGLSGTIIALVGHRIEDKKLIGGYIKAGLYYRNKLYVILGISCAIAFPLTVWKYHWYSFTIVILLLSIISNLFFSGWTSYYTPPLRMHQRVATLYKTQIKSGLVRLFIICCMNAIYSLNSWIAAISGSIQTFLNGYFTKKAAHDYIDTSFPTDPKLKKEITQIIKPIIPGILFSAFQSQIMVFLSAIFGQTQEVAEMGALTRIGQLYFILSTAGSVLIAPYIAKLPKNKLLSRFIFMLSGVIIFCFIITLLGYYRPELFLWILGEKYKNLTNELSLLLITSGIGLINSIIWEMYESRKWIFWWDPISVIVCTLTLQILFIIFLKDKSIYNILLLTLIVNSLVLCIRICVVLYGLKYKNE